MAKIEPKFFSASDPFGTTFFAELKAKFGDPAKLAKVYQRRFENITTVFEHRTKIAHELHSAPDDTWYDRREKEKIEERLKTFKSADFLIAALQALLDEKIRDEATMPVKKPRYSGGWR